MPAKRFASSSISTVDPNSAATSLPADSGGFVNPVITSTPSADGMIYHVVKSGEVLFNIALAYGITLDYLKEENKLTSDQGECGHGLDDQDGTYAYGDPRHLPSRRFTPRVLPRSRLRLHRLPRC